MRKNLVEAYRGWWVWHRMVRKYHIGATAVVLLPGMNPEYNRSALLFLDQMLTERKYENAVIMTVDEVIVKCAELFSDNLLGVELISRKQAKRLMQFYCLYEFDSRFMVASLDEPEGRNAYRLIGVKGTTVEELIALGVYRLPDYEEPAMPSYVGNDESILNILRKRRGEKMNIEYIIVQAGGKGTRMGHLTHNKPKALVPVGNLPMLFHLFRQFPDKKFIVIGDYKYSVLEKYLEAFADVDYRLVSGRGFHGTCAGIRKALEYIPDGRNFMLIWSDLVLPDDYELPRDMGNYIGIAKDFPCRWKFENGEFAEEQSRKYGVAGLFVFQEKEVLNEVPENGEFVRWLKTCPFEKKELELYRTKEYGLVGEYEKQLARQICRPFNKITAKAGVIIKEPVDKQGQDLAVYEKEWYRVVMTKGFKQIPHIYTTEPLTMERIDGNNIYMYRDLSFGEKKEILTQIVECLRQVHAIGEVPADFESCYEAYIGKTFERLKKVRGLVPFADDEEIMINGKLCRNVFFWRTKLEELVKEYMPHSFGFIHGDCTFSNILLRNDGTPVLIDPRGYFGRTKIYGDTAYDWAKLYYSVVGNYDQFNLKRFSLDIGERDVRLQVESNHWEDMEDTLFELLSGEATQKQMKLFHALIWLSLTTYAWEDYDSICGAFYNGLFYLEDLL